MRIEPQPIDLNVWLYHLDAEWLQLLSEDGCHTTFPAKSGPYGQGPLPLGAYIIGTPVAIEADDPKNVPYKDDRDFAWWCPLTPMFATTRLGFGIHPDGNVPGTQGCVGIDPGTNTRAAFDLLKSQPRKVLYVV